MIKLFINDVSISVPEQCNVTAALAIAGLDCTRRSVTGMPRLALCGMGVCQECRICINGRPHQLGCQTLCSDDMRIDTDDKKDRA